MTWVARIADLVGWTPLGVDVPWSEAEAELGTALPGDYKVLCETFGRGQFCEWLTVYSSSESDRNQLFGHVDSLRGLGDVGVRLPPAGRRQPRHLHVGRPVPAGLRALGGRRLVR